MEPGRIVTGQRLIGRESRLSRLRTAVERARDERHPRLACVTGATGVGKSALLHSLVDQLPEGVLLAMATAAPDAGPYAAAGALLDSLAPQLARRTEPVDGLVGSGADVILDLAPSWGALLPSVQAQPLHRDPEHVRTRLRMTVHRVFTALAERCACLVLVVDDLQHADRQTIDVLGDLLNDDGIPLLVVGAFAGKEVDRALLGRPPVTVELRPLSDAAVIELVADALGMSTVDVAPLASVILSDTGSNPLAVGQLLHWLHEQGLLRYDPARATWTWQLDRIAAIAPAGARVERVVRARLTEVEPELRAAAVLGDRFETAAPLDRAAHAELVRETGDGTYAWTHPLLREAVLDATPAAERTATAKALLAQPPESRLLPLLALVDETVVAAVRRAELHLAAARVANRRGGTQLAHEHLQAGLQVLPANGWRRYYPLAFDLHVEGARTARAVGDAPTAERLLDIAEAKAHNDLDRALVWRARLVLRWRLRGYGGDPRPGLEALRLLQVDLPDPDAERAVWAAAADTAVREVHSRLSDVELAEPVETDDRVRIAADLIAEMLPALEADADMSALLAARGVELALEHGQLAGASYALAWLGVAIATRLGDEAIGRRCAELAIARPDPYAPDARATVALTLPFLVGTAQTTLALLREAHERFLERGDVGSAMAILLQRPNFLLAIGAPIDEVATELAESGRLLAQHPRYPLGQVIAEAVSAAVARLRGEDTEPAPAPLAEPSPSPRAEPAPAALAEQVRRGELGYTSSLHLTSQLMAAYLLGDHVEAIRLAEVAERIPAPHWSGFLGSERRFYHALALAARFRSASQRQRKQWTKKIDVLRIELERWARHRPAGFAHKALLISAEQARLAGDVETAMGRYERVIGGSRENGFLHVQAIAAELGGRCALEHAGPAEALAYLRRSRDCYARWGARAKLRQLDALLAGAPKPARRVHPVDQLDLLNVVKAFQTISSVLDLDKLTATLLELLVQHAGAQRGCLLLRDGGGLRLAAEATNDSDLVAVTRDPGRELASRVPVSLVEHTVASRDLTLHGAGAFAADPYLRAHRPRAFLAAPIAHQDRLIGVLYLEHRHRADAFGPGQLNSLEVLCTQAAICLDNAAMYAKLTEANRVLDATFERLPVGLIVLRPDLTVHRASPHAVRLLGLPISTGIPLVDLIDVLTPVDIDGQPLRLSPWLAEIGPDSWQDNQRKLVIVRPDGRRQTLEMWLIPLRDQDGRLLGVTLLVTEP